MFQPRKDDLKKVETISKENQKDHEINLHLAHDHPKHAAQHIWHEAIQMLEDV